MASMFQRICSEVAWCRQDVLEATWTSQSKSVVKVAKGVG
jgi:hypothetical protein